MANATMFLKLLKLLALVFCFSSFVAILNKQVNNYFNQKTGTVTSSNDMPKIPFPVMVFCPREASDNTNYDENHLADKYNETVRDYKVTLQAIGYHKDDRTPFDGYEEGFLYTIFNGRCKVFKITDEIPVRKGISFYIEDEIPSTLFLLPNPRDEAFLASLIMTPEMSMIPIDGHTMIGMIRKDRNLLNRKTDPCIEDHQVTKETENCINNLLRKHLIRQGLACVSLQFAKFIPNMTLCNDFHLNSYATLNATSFLASWMAGERPEEEKCHCMCKNIGLDIKASSMTIGGRPIYATDENGNRTQHSVVVINFLTNIVQTNEEYLLYDELGILSAIGGGMGMFLGWSFYQMFKDCIQWLAMKKPGRKGHG